MYCSTHSFTNLLLPLLLHFSQLCFYWMHFSFQVHLHSKRTLHPIKTKKCFKLLRADRCREKTYFLAISATAVLVDLAWTKRLWSADIDVWLWFFCSINLLDPVITWYGSTIDEKWPHFVWKFGRRARRHVQNIQVYLIINTTHE